MAQRPRFLIDENLSVRLADIAHEQGFEAVHVNHRGLGGMSDRAIMQVVLAQDWTLVTNNVVEFRARFRREALHAGIVLFLTVARRENQIAMFRAVLADVAADPEIVNTAIEVDHRGATITVRRYAIP